MLNRYQCRRNGKCVASHEGNDGEILAVQLSQGNRVRDTILTRNEILKIYLL